MLALEAVVVLEAVVDAFQRSGLAAVEDTCPEGMHVELAEVKAAALDNCPERMHAAEVEEAAVDNCLGRIQGLKSTEKTNMGNSEAAEPVRREAGMALEALLALEAVLVLEAMVALVAL